MMGYDGIAWVGLGRYCARCVATGRDGVGQVERDRRDWHQDRMGQNKDYPGACWARGRGAVPMQMCCGAGRDGASGLRCASASPSIDSPRSRSSEATSTLPPPAARWRGVSPCFSPTASSFAPLPGGGIGWIEWGGAGRWHTWSCDGRYCAVWWDGRTVGFPG